jgi:alpha-galactosidase
LSYWGELRRRHPGMLIDTCASGGRRNDLETLRRAVPLLRSDYILEPVGQQNHTMGIAQWIPYYGTGVNDANAYDFRSQMCPWITGVYDVRRKDLDYDAIRRLIGQWRAVSRFYAGDFYPLTPYAADATQWVAWQFHDPGQDAGFVQAFRRDQSIYESASLKLRGLDATARYLVTDLDSGKTRELSGGALSAGLTVELKQQPASALIRYRRKP